MTTSDVLKVFLASPSDVSRERGEAPKIVSEINKNLSRASVDIRVELLMWEEQLPGYGRPQSQINPQIDACDIFVGLVWKRWGTPTGVYTSGFEEEFERAIARRRREGRPEIVLYFIEVPKAIKLDPGEQLQQVINFRARQEAAGEVLFNVTKDAKQWAKEFKSFLDTRMLRLAHQKSPSDDAGTKRPPLGSGTEPPEVTLPALLPPPSSSTEIEDLAFLSLSEIEAVRLHLTTASLVSRRYTGALFEVHDLNLAYKHRLSLALSETTIEDCRRSMLGHGEDSAPGWFWSRELDDSSQLVRLLLLIRDDSDEDVRMASLGLLAQTATVIPEEMWSQLPLADHSWRVRNAAFDYLARIGNDAAVALFPERADEPVLSTAQNSKLILLCRVNPVEAMRHYMSEEAYFSDEATRALIEIVPKCDTAQLQAALSASDEKLRAAALTELHKRSEVPSDMVRACLADPSMSVRKEALLTLLDLEDFPPLEDARTLVKLHESPLTNSIYGLGSTSAADPNFEHLIVLKYFQTFDYDALKQAVDWYSQDGETAYEALGEVYFERCGADIRADLETGFVRIKEWSLQRRVDPNGSSLADEYEKQFAKFDSFFRSRFTIAALSAISRHGNETDVNFGRRFCRNDDWKIQLFAVQILHNCGSSEDEQTLVDIAIGEFNTSRELAAKAALKVAPNQAITALRLLKSSSPGVQRIAIGALLESTEQPVKEMFASYLMSKSPTERLQGVFYIAMHSTDDELLTHLNEYLSHQTYFYNVVSWLDRLLYAPTKIRAVFIEQLKAQVC